MNFHAMLPSDGFVLTGVLLHQQDTKVKYVSPITKFDRKTYKPRERVMIVTNAGIYFLDPESFKLSYRLDFSLITVCLASRNKKKISAHAKENKREIYK